MSYKKPNWKYSNKKRSRNFYKSRNNIRKKYHSASVYGLLYHPNFGKNGTLGTWS